MTLLIAGMVVLGSLVGCDDERADPPAYGAFLAFSVAGEAGPAGSPLDPPLQQIWLRSFFAGPDLSMRADYIQQTARSFCMAFSWAASEQVPNIDMVSAGTLTITGHESVGFTTWPPPPDGSEAGQIPSSLACDRVEIDSDRSVVACPPLEQANGVVPGSNWLTDESAMTLSVSGGANIGAFREEGIKVPRAPAPAGSFDLNAVDPLAGVTAAWGSTSASHVVVELFAQVVDAAKLAGGQIDASELAQIICMEPAASRSKAIPEGALASIPQPADNSELLVIQTVLLGANVTQRAEGWGQYMVGAGRGTFGTTCRVASGDLCPPPPEGNGN
jgi:hypothetical protein